MEQTLTVKIRIQPNKQQEQLLTQSSQAYIKVVNGLVSEMVEDKKSTKKTSKDVKANLNSAVKNQAIKYELCQPLSGKFSLVHSKDVIY